MRLTDLIETTLKLPAGEVTYSWKRDLADEEGDDYLPSGYSYDKVLELELLKAAPTLGGRGDKAMTAFLAIPAAQRAELIFCDLNPHMGPESSARSETEIMRRTEEFCKRHGFRNKYPQARLWLVRKGMIPDKELPT